MGQETTLRKYISRSRSIPSTIAMLQVGLHRQRRCPRKPDHSSLFQSCRAAHRVLQKAQSPNLGAISRGKQGQLSTYVDIIMLTQFQKCQNTSKANRLRANAAKAAEYKGDKSKAHRSIAFLMLLKLFLLSQFQSMIFKQSPLSIPSSLPVALSSKLPVIMEQIVTLMIKSEGRCLSTLFVM